MVARKTDRWIVIGLMAALAVECLWLLTHLGVLSWSKRPVVSGLRPAGQVVKNENELRRRAVDSLVWEKSAADEVVFYHDSILTLTQSTALLRLEHGAEVELHENTLVTIEPAEETSRGEIRLKFVRGNLRARNPWTATRIAAPDFVVDVKAGSELQMRQTGEQEFEVQVKKGEAKVTDAQGQHELSETDLLRVKQGHSESLRLDADLRWTSPPPARIYAHEDAASVWLRWEGQATELRVQRTGRPEQVYPLAKDQRELKLELDLGDYLAYLRSSGRTSAALPVQMWRAPLVHLIMPLPRNRVRTQDQTFFLWTRVPEVQKYAFKLKGEKTAVDEQVSGNSFQSSFTGEDDAQWSVWGVDREGYPIPPLYEYPIFIRDEPFAPPTLNAPRLRKPAQDKGAFLWGLLLPTAHADEDRFEATFSWAEVPGAELYWLEISESADFRKPLVSKKISKTEFVWREFRDRNYFWRVAAGNRAGRMGVFSEPAQVSIHEGVEIKKIEAQVTAPEIVAPPTPPPAAAETPPVRLHEARFLRIMWRGGYKIFKAEAAENVQANLSGIQLFGLSVEGDIFKQETHWWNLDAKYLQATFKPEPKEDYPFQKDISTQEIDVRLTRVKAASPWGFGVSLISLPEIERKDLEEIRAVARTLGGAHLRGHFARGAHEHQTDLGVHVGSGEFGLSAKYRWLFPAMRRVRTGWGAEVLYLQRGSYQTLNADGFLTLGFEF